MARSEQISVPREARNAFEQADAIPLDIVSELFGRAKIPTQLQAAFWETVAEKQHKSFAWKSIRIKTRRDGTKELILISSSIEVIKFQIPDDLTDEQLEEMKRAQSANLPGVIDYQLEDGGKRPVNFVEVFERPEEKKEGGELF